MEVRPTGKRRFNTVELAIVVGKLLKSFFKGHDVSFL
jgi:hypothetical protein